MHGGLTADLSTNVVLKSINTSICWFMGCWHVFSCPLLTGFHLPSTMNNWLIGRVVYWLICIEYTMYPGSTSFICKASQDVDMAFSATRVSLSDTILRCYYYICTNSLLQVQPYKYNCVVFSDHPWAFIYLYSTYRPLVYVYWRHMFTLVKYF